jgi:antitoxin component of RelBE/YafQ-DinJ toxin-antitoxin module
MATQYRINLVVDDKLEQILAFLRARNPLLKDVDLIRLAVGESYTARLSTLPIDYLTDEETQSVLKAVSTKNKDDPSFDNVEDLMNYLNNFTEQDA